MTRTSLCGCILLAMAGWGFGCRSAPESPYAEYARPAADWTPRRDSGNAFDGYALAADRAVQLAPESARRVFFTPGMAAATQKALAPAVADVVTASRRPCDIPDLGGDPFAPDPRAAGFRLLGRGLAWSITTAVDEGDWARAVDLTLAATKFGLDLTGGDASLGSLGEAIVTEARQALAPALGRMPPEQLSRLAEGLGSRLAGVPDTGRALGQEEARMLAGIQRIQDAYRDRKVSSLRPLFGRDAREALDYLERMPADERPRYFDGFAAEGRTMLQQAQTASAVPVADRTAPPELKGDYRPWRRLSRHLFSGPAAIITTRDRVVAMTRLFLLSAAIRARVANGGRAPGALSGFPATWRTDPYTGRDFVYTAEGSDFRLYGVGADLRDDGGETDEAGLSPDMSLEAEGP